MHDVVMRKREGERREGRKGGGRKSSKFNMSYENLVDFFRYSYGLNQ
jgi:hypothetical protein